VHYSPRSDKYRLAALGLDYFNARWYDSSLGRFAQADSIVPLASQGAQAWDRYAYTNNNPVRYTDPSGHCILCLAAAIGGGVFLGTAIYNNFIREPLEPADVNASNLGGLLLAGYEHAGHANITGEGLQSLQEDPSVQAAQERIVDRIASKPGYGEQAFSLQKDLEDQFTANGPNRSWSQAARAGNPAFWMVHTGNLSATDINVSANGTMEITWVVSDNFDYIPDWDNSGDRDGSSYWAYNIFATIIYPIYNDVLDAKEQVPVNAKWDETISPVTPY